MKVWPAVFAATAWLFLLGVVVQVFLAGAGVFELTDWTLHVELGWGLGSGVLLVLLFAVAARPGRATLLLAIALAVSGCIQPALAEARTAAPLVAALHPVNAFVLCWLAWLVARRSLAAVRNSRRHAVPVAEGREPLEEGTAARL